MSFLASFVSSHDGSGRPAQAPRLEEVRQLLHLRRHVLARGAGWFEQLEEDLLKETFVWLDGTENARVSACSFQCLLAAYLASKARLDEIMAAAGLLLSRWRSPRWAIFPFGEQERLLLGAQFFNTLCGCFQVARTTIEIRPDGSFKNVGLHHEMHGQATVAGVVYKCDIPQGCFERVPDDMQVLYACQLDRWYTLCRLHGQDVAPDELPFVGPGRQCYSVVAWLESCSDDAPKSYAFMENHPHPNKSDGWNLVDNPFSEAMPRILTWAELQEMLKRSGETEDDASSLHPGGNDDADDSSSEA
eukprot:TRINITY_DN67666_c0_g1_i1.p1 TRINITY_DN67666_c0_g1~~TRINITY_DN67666_c0_g1_i1.p1  ORF type:complete len:303 (-),score=31.73 TRINITY_DN67666_c0_g1_i1:306-1214(-)